MNQTKSRDIPLYIIQYSRRRQSIHFSESDFAAYLARLYDRFDLLIHPTHDKPLGNYFPCKRKMADCYGIHYERMGAGWNQLCGNLFIRYNFYRFDIYRIDGRCNPKSFENRYQH